jgi:radical SAM superfamily enzyme YgiQ (UPF0313 family)
VPDVLIAQLPSPPRRTVFREWAGGMGTALASAREEYGHDQKYYDIPYSAYLYIARQLEQAGLPFAYRDFQATETLPLADFKAAVAAVAPRVLVTQVNLPSLGPDLELLRHARAAAPGLQIVLLGATAKWFKHRILSEGHADLVVDENEELVTADIIAALLSGDETGLQACSIWRDGAIRTLPARSRMTTFDFIDFPAYELLDFSRYESDHYLDTKYRYATVFTTKGCPYKCGYCPYPFGFGKRLVYRSPARVGADIERLHKEFGVGQILFRDQVFTINPNHARGVCEELIRRNLDIVWVCETRYDTVDEEMLRLMYRAGCREVHFGLESGDPEMFANVAKSDGPQSLELFQKAIGWARDAGMRVHLHCIVGMPDESWVSVRNTTRFLRSVKPHSVQLAYFVPYPGTPLYAELAESKELGDVTALDWQALGSFTDPVLPTRHLSVDEVRRARNRIAVDWQFTIADRVWRKMRRTLGLAGRAA